jgi:hypothetical protein
MHGSKQKTHLKGHLIVDYGTYFVHVPDFADSVQPEGWISNSTMEVGLHVLSKELEAQKKCVMPLIIAVSVTYKNPLTFLISMFSNSKPIVTRFCL